MVVKKSLATVVVSRTLVVSIKSPVLSVVVDSVVVGADDKLSEVVVSSLFIEMADSVVELSVVVFDSVVKTGKNVKLLPEVVVSLSMT